MHGPKLGSLVSIIRQAVHAFNLSIRKKEAGDSLDLAGQLVWLNQRTCSESLCLKIYSGERTEGLLLYHIECTEPRLVLSQKLSRAQPV